MEYAIIKDGKVIDRIVSDKAFADKYAKEKGATVSSSKLAQVGFEKSGSKFADKRKKPPKQSSPSIDLTNDEALLLIEFYKANGIITAKRAKEMRG